MSLFHTHEWWSHKPDIASECSPSSLLVANIDNDAANTDKIVTGSFTGHLRIFYPRTSGGYQIDHLILEHAFDEPIIAIAAGKFVSNSPRLTLAVLFPKKLSVYNVTSNGGQYYELNHCYTHRFNHHAYTMTYGPFGLSRQSSTNAPVVRDCVAVLTIDCELILFEAETFAFKRFIPSLLPGALAYCAKSDSILLSTATHEVESYRYSVLGESVSTKEKESEEEKTLESPANGDSDKSNVNSEKKLQCDWKLNLGEPILDIVVGRLTANQPAGSLDIAVLTRYTLYMLKNNGSIRWSKRFTDFAPLSMTLFPSANSDQNLDHLMIGNEEQSLYVYRESTLIWAARTMMSPVAIRVGTFNNTRGLIVTLNDTNEVIVQYLGTSIPKSQIAIHQQSSEVKELDYDSMDNQHRKLMKVIKQAAGDKMQEPKEKLIIKANCPVNNSFNVWADTSQLSIGSGEKFQLDDRNRLISLNLVVTLTHTSVKPLTNITVILTLPSFLYTPAHKLTVEQLMPSSSGGGSTSDSQSLVFPLLVRAECFPTSLIGDIGCTFTTSDGLTRTCRSEVKLPLVLAGRLKLPIKNTNYCLTFDSNKSPPSLIEVFDDLFDTSPVLAMNGNGRASYENSTHVLSFFHWCDDSDVTLLVSKKTGRYRLQASTLNSFNMLAQELAQRLSVYYTNTNAGSGGEEFALSFQDDLPLNDYFTCIDNHFTARLSILRLRTSIDKFSQQFRAIQKRLLIRFKDKNPIPLINFDLLLKQTHGEIQSMTDALHAAYQELRAHGVELHCTSAFLSLLATLKYNLDKKNQEVLRQLLNVNTGEDRISGVSLDINHGWEERVDAALVHTLKYMLTKNPSQSSTATSGANSQSVFDSVKDVGRLHKHLSMMFERLNKGLRFVPIIKPEQAAASKPAPSGPGTPPASAGGERRRRGPSMDLRESVNALTQQAIEEAEEEEQQQ